MSQIHTCQECVHFTTYEQANLHLRNLLDRSSGALAVPTLLAGNLANRPPLPGMNVDGTRTCQGGEKHDISTRECFDPKKFKPRDPPQATPNTQSP